MATEDTIESSSSSNYNNNGNGKQHQRHWDYGGNPLAHTWSPESAQGQAYGPSAAQLQPGLYKEVDPQKANPAPLGLSGFALTTFVLSIINLGTRGVAHPNIVAGPALAYGGLIQLLAGMWEISVGNTFGAWALSSYGGFWISLGIILTPGLFQIEEEYGGATSDYFTAFGFYIIGWFIFTFIVWLGTLRSTLVFSALIMNVWLAFLMLGTGYIDNGGGMGAAPNEGLIIAGGAFGIIAAFLAWWVMIAGLLTPSNSFFTIPVFHFPWSPEGRKRSGKDAEKNG